MILISYLVYYNTLIHNATDIITKCDSCFIAKFNTSLLKNALNFILKSTTVLLQNETVITKCVNFIMRQLLQYASLITKCIGTSYLNNSEKYPSFSTGLKKPN